jgi:UDP-2,3-diacylglucosamine pyrophosphatase LpxH
VRRRFKLAGHWSLADYAKRNIQGAAGFISGFEVAVARHGKALAVNGVICGHIHTPAIKQLDGVIYLNCGDWVDSCTAIVERVDGTMELVRHVAAGDEPGELEDELAEAA